MFPALTPCTAPAMPRAQPQDGCLDSRLMQSLSSPGSEEEPIKSAHTASLMPQLQVLGNYDGYMKPFPRFAGKSGGESSFKKKKNAELIMDFPAAIMFEGLSL